MAKMLEVGKVFQRLQIGAEVEKDNAMSLLYYNAPSAHRSPQKYNS